MWFNEIGEFGFIKRISSESILNKSGVIKGIGDDCSVRDIGNNQCLIITTDLLIENVHFKISSINPYDLGYKSLAVNLSDVAAMGACPSDIYLSLGIPDNYKIEDLDDFYMGLKELCKKHNLNIMGGDTTSSEKGLVINIAVIGFSEKGQVLYRHGARPGDIIFVSGCLGDSGCGLDIILNNRTDETNIGSRFYNLYKAHIRPYPYVDEGMVISSSGCATSMVDISDGLAQDLSHVLKQSDAGADIDWDMLPKSKDMLDYCGKYKVSPDKMMLNTGEDYILLLTISSDKEKQFINQYKKKTGKDIYKIGYITDSRKLMMTKDGTTTEIEQSGWDHFNPRD